MATTVDSSRISRLALTRPWARPVPNAGLWVAAAWLVVVVVGAVAAPLLPVPGPTISDYTALSSPPGTSGHLLGTDQLGRDLLSRVLYGARVSLVVSVLAVALAMAVGVMVGVVAGYKRRTVEAAALVGCDAVMAFPPIIFIIVVVSMYGASFVTLVAGLSVVFLPTFLRLARATALAITPRDFVSAARVGGASDLRVIRKEILPNVIPSVVAYSVVALSAAIVAEGSLSFLGLGLPPPSSSWGAMINYGLSELDTYPHIALVPALTLFITVLSINVIGEAARQRLDGRSR